jgi:hypothetical protein
MLMGMLQVYRQRYWSFLRSAGSLEKQITAPQVSEVVSDLRQIYPKYYAITDKVADMYVGGVRPSQVSHNPVKTGEIAHPQS